MESSITNPAAAAAERLSRQRDAARIPDARSFERLRNDEHRLRTAARSFEQLFITQMLDAMRDTLRPEHDLLDAGATGEIWQDRLYDQYAAILAKRGGLGVADMIVEQYRG